MISVLLAAREQDLREVVRGISLEEARVMLPLCDDAGAVVRIFGCALWT